MIVVAFYILVLMLGDAQFGTGSRSMLRSGRLDFESTTASSSGGVGSNNGRIVFRSEEEDTGLGVREQTFPALSNSEKSSYYDAVTRTKLGHVMGDDVGARRPLDLINRGIPSSSGSRRFQTSTSTKPLCPLTPPDLLGRLEIHFNDTPPTLDAVRRNNPHVMRGGWYEPSNCIARSRVAFIIPHRARELHLRALLWHLHPIFQRQQLAYKIYVVHQSGDLAFNKAKLMNIGFKEALQDDDFDCVVFHDVDLLPEDDRLLYRCDETPKHFSVAIDKYGYRLPYLSLFGGVTMVSPEQFRDVNGYSNMYWGWGGEDDDMFNRVFSRGYTIRRPPHHLARYKMTFHNRDSGNRLNLMRYEILERSVNRMQEDGLNSVKYEIKSRYELPVYTNITADVGTAVVQCKSYLSAWTCRFVLWLCEHFVVSCSMLQYNSTDDGTLDLSQLAHTSQTL